LLTVREARKGRFATMPQKLTEKKVQQLQYTGKNHTVRDTQVIGLFVDVGKVSKSYKCQADLWAGDRGRRSYVRTVRVTLGKVGELPLDVARVRASELLAQIKAGVDPVRRPTPTPTALTVAAAFESYAQRCINKGRATRTIADMERYLGYLDSWRLLPLASITKAMARAEHARLTSDVGPSSANKAMRALRAVWNHANKTRDEDFDANPVRAVDFHEDREKNRSIDQDDLAEWYASVQKLPNTLRRLMHELGLFTGLRPGNLVSLERAWVRLTERAIVIPADRMKARREFSLPLSEHLVGLVQRVLTLSEVLEPGSPWLFPTRDANSEVTHTQTWRERSLPSETGHILRHTYSNMAMVAGLDGDARQLLLAQSVEGVRGTYLHTPALWTRLLAEQERVSRFLLGKVQP
jgi:integrase